MSRKQEQADKERDWSRLQGKKQSSLSKWDAQSKWHRERRRQEAVGRGQRAKRAKGRGQEAEGREGRGQRGQRTDNRECRDEGREGKQGRDEKE
jgi:hypothetical protein